MLTVSVSWYSVVLKNFPCVRDMEYFKYSQARRVDSVEGGSFIFWDVYFSDRGASLLGDVWGHAPPPPPKEILQI